MQRLTLILLTMALASCGVQKERIPAYSPFDDDVAFLERYGEVIVLADPAGQSRVAVMPGLQGRVMTSTAGAPARLSFGWINRPFFEAGETSVHMNAYGGEERLWLGPEGGQFSIFFPPDSAFTFDNWHAPRLIDLDPFDVVSRDDHAATFEKSASLVNYSGTPFDIRIRREVRVIEPARAFSLLGVPTDTLLQTVAYQTINQLHNAGQSPWHRSTGLLSIWLLGMFNPSPQLTMVIPYRTGPEAELGPVVNDDYFGKVPADRLIVGDSAIFFKGDGEHRSKIGLNPGRSRGIMGSYDGVTHTLTVVTFTEGLPDDVYVNSKWEIQQNPYAGDVINAYNDGPPAPGERPMGPFYELESSSPARALQPGEHTEHVQTTFHFQGPEDALDALARATLGVSLADIREAFRD